VQSRLWLLGLALLAVLGQYACGGGGGGSSGTAGGGGIEWPSRGETPSSSLPPAVVTGRVVFESASGESCCVAVDPSLLSGSAERGLAILNDLPIGPATVTVAGFTTDFAPTVDGIATTCTTSPAGAAQPCDPQRVAAPAFESAPISVDILAGVQTNLPPVQMDALPFLFDFSPAQNASAPAPVQFALTVVDAVTGIRADSVALEVSFSAPEDGSPFRALTKRVPLDLTACADGSGDPCSPGGTLELAGFHADGTAPELPEGEVEAHVTAENLAVPPRALDFRYSLFVLATATETATATPTAPTESSPANATITRFTITSRSPASGAVTPALDSSARAGAAAPQPTPTATPTPRTIRVHVR
jgi:hypothetical protein